MLLFPSTLACFLLVIARAKAEVFTAVTHMGNLLTAESEVIGAMTRYLQSEEQRLGKIRQFLGHYEKFHSDAAHQGGDKFLANPVNAFLLVKKLTRDWGQVQSVMSENPAEGIISNITARKEELGLPDEEDLNGAAHALLRLQETYQLDTTAMAKGVIQGVPNLGVELTAGDCFELGRQSYVSGDYKKTVLWMNEAETRRLREGDASTATEEDVVEYLAFSAYMMDDVDTALRLTDRLLKLVPDHPRALGNKVYYEASLRKVRRSRMGDSEDAPKAKNFGLAAENVREKRSTSEGDQVDEGTDDSPMLSPYTFPDEERRMYEKLCRKDVGQSPKVTAALKCSYFDNNGNSFLTIGPVKMEEVYLKPRIVLFHDVIYDDEIAVIKELATPRLRRATVQDHATGDLKPAEYRISKSAWLKTEEHPFISRLLDRIEAITSLNMETAEELQVGNYGLGGHYEPHYDFARKDEINAFQSLGTGNRIATWLNYMSDVEAGGATVFPALRLALFPEKGSAAFWYNLYKNGEGDYLTRHAACPVLAGSKWVSNKWFHEIGQEFKRPCGLSPDE